MVLVVLSTEVDTDVIEIPVVLVVIAAAAVLLVVVIEGGLAVRVFPHAENAVAMATITEQPVEIRRHKLR